MARARRTSTPKRPATVGVRQTARRSTLAPDARLMPAPRIGALRWCGCAIALCALACGSQRDAAGTARGNGAAGDRATATSSLSPSGVRAATGSAPDAGHCPHDGRWRLCSVAVRLDKAGLAPVADTTGPGERLAFLSVPGHHFRLGRGELRAYLYPDSAALARDVAGLDTVRVAPRGGQYTWAAPATLIQTGNLLAILLTANEHQIERVQLALGGGAPSRGSEPPR